MDDTSLKKSSMYLSFSSLTGGGGDGDPVSMSPLCDGLLGASKPYAYVGGIVAISSAFLLMEDEAVYNLPPPSRHAKENTSGIGYAWGHLDLA